MNASGSDGPLDPYGEPEEQDMLIIDVNVKGALFTVKLALHYMDSDVNQDKSINITTSIASHVDMTLSIIYTASKYAMRGTMRALRGSSPQRGIRVNCIAPWRINSRFMNDRVKSFLDEVGMDPVNLDDAKTLAGKLTTDTSINGTTYALLPKSLSPQGYEDLKEKEPDEYLQQLQQKLNDVNWNLRNIKNN